MEYDSNTRSLFSSYPVVMRAPVTHINQLTTTLQSTSFHSLANYAEGLSQTVSDTTPVILYDSQPSTSHLILKLPNLPSIENIKTDIEYCMYVSTSGVFSVSRIQFNVSSAKLKSPINPRKSPKKRLINYRRSPQVRLIKSN